jgi:hypothetical protein
MLLIVVEDRQANAVLRPTLASARSGGAPFVVLTADALLVMRLTRDGIDARLPLDTFTRDGAPAEIEGSDRQALDGAAAAIGQFATFDGTNFAPYLEYTLIPSFVRAVRNVTAIASLFESMAVNRLVLVGGGALVQAARLVASRRAVPIEHVAGDPISRALHAIRRLRAGSATRWVNTEFRALVLEPGFLSLLFTKALWRRLIGPAIPLIQPDAIIVAGDRFTADVVERLRGGARQIVLAGATQPGRALFDRTASLVPIEAFARVGDLFRALAATFDAAARAASLATSAAHGEAFMAGSIGYWPLVRRTAAFHVLMWTPLLRQLDALAARAAQAVPRGHVLTANDVTAYNRVLIDAARRHGVASTGIQHGMTAEPNGHSMAHVDTLAVWGEQAEEWYRVEAAKRGRQQRARFVVTGNPRYDTLAVRTAAPGPQPSALDHQPSAISDQPSAISHQPSFAVCICTGFLTDFSVSASDLENFVMIETVLEWARRHPDVRVVHKIHPGEELRYYTEAARVLGWDPAKLTITDRPILHDLLAQSQALVCAYSSTILESIALGTPVVVFDALTRRRLVGTPGHPIGRVPGVAIACSTIEVGERLDAIKVGPPADRGRLRASAELRAFLSDLDGQAAARVAALVG